MSEREYVYRTYKISINVWFFSYYGDASMLKLPKGFIPVVVGVFYSFLTLFLGFITYNPVALKKSFEAIGINLFGGEDITEILERMEYDDRTNYVHQNLLRKTQNEIGLDEVSLILEIQDIYSRRFKNNFSEENIQFIIQSLSKIEIQQINKDHVIDIFDGLKLYENSLEKSEIY